MRYLKWAPLVLVVAAVVLAAAPAGAQEFKLNLDGATYTKWLWGNQRYDGSMYNFTTVPGEGWGDNGQGSEIELFLDARVSKQVEVKARLHSRFNQNEWTNYGGWGGNNPPTVPCVGGDCGEMDPRSNQYVKLRGVSVYLTPGYKWLDLATIGASDLGMFDPYTVGKIRYIDRDNAAGIFFQGGLFDKALHYDFARISLPRLWAGPNWETGTYTAADAAYALQLGYKGSSLFDITGIGYYVNDIEVDATDLNWDNGRDIRTRFRDSVVGLKVGIHPGTVFDFNARYYKSAADSACDLAPCTFGLGGYSTVPSGKHNGDLWKANVDINDPFGIGLSFQVEGFDIAADYVSLMAARRESDVLLTEGYDAAYAFGDPDNSKFGMWPGNPTLIGFGGWDGNAQQVATINVDNEFSDFDEPMAETAIGWKGFTFVPLFSAGGLQLQGEYTKLGYNTNWQNWGRLNGPVDSTEYPMLEPPTGVGHSYRSAYAPFQDKSTDIYLVKGKYVLDVGKGIDIFGKVKWIKETDKRMNDARYLPYQAGDCPGNGQPCAGNVNYYYTSQDGSTRYSTSSIYGNPPVITVNGVTGYQWKPFDSLSDDDRDMDYRMFQLGAGYQLTNDLYGSFYYENYDVNLQDGDTAFSAYRANSLASGKHTKDKWSVNARYILAGMEFGLTWQYITGDFTPDFGGGFVPQVATESIAAAHHVPVGSLGYALTPWGDWNSLEKRNFNQQRLKAWMKVVF